MPPRAECGAIIRSIVSALVEFGLLGFFGVRLPAHLIAVKIVLGSLWCCFPWSLAKHSRTVPSSCLFLAWSTAGIFKHKLGTLFDFHLCHAVEKL
jgi:hypothetical protein